jgi:apolipoprotein N-acyltransferase
MSSPVRHTRWWPLAAAAATLPFANGAASIPIVAWLAPAFLMRFVRGRRALVALPIAYLLIVAAYAFQFREMAPLSGAAYFILMATLALPAMLPYALDRWFRRRLGDSPASLLIFPATATALQFLGAFGRFGSWGTLAYSQYGNLALMQLLSVTGLWGIDFLLFAAAPVINCVWEHGLAAPMARRAATGFAAVVAVVLAVGGARLTRFAPASPTVRIASLSHVDVTPAPEIDRWHRILDGSATAADRQAVAAWSKAVADELFARVDREAAAGAKLVFWDETGVQVLVEDEAPLLARGAAVAARLHIYLGMSLGTWTSGQLRPLQNKLVLIDPNGRVAWTYHKTHPVPAIEAPVVADGDGKLPAVDTPFGRLSAIICADADYPRLLEQAGAMKADILIDPSNDWRGIDPWHTQMASFRAIEEGVTLVRQTNTGLSAAFDPHGVTLASMDHFQTEDRVLVVHAPTAGVRTVYAWLGDWFGWLCVAVVLFLLAFALHRRSAGEVRVTPAATP